MTIQSVLAIRDIFSIRESQASSIIRERYDRRSLLQKIVDFALSWFRQIKYSFFVLAHSLFFLDRRQCGDVIARDAGSRGMVVLVHGLNSYPSAWFEQLSDLKRRPDITVFTPYVPRKGRCALEEAYPGILSIILNYTHRNPEKPVCLLGASNGARIAMKCEIAMRTRSPRTTVKSSHIAGVLHGTSQMNFLECLGLARCFFPHVLRNELKYCSGVAERLWADATASLPEGCAVRSNECYATTEDLSVPDLDSSLIPGGEWHVLHGQSHGSIISAVAREQIRSCVEWIDRFPGN
jgi:hypothetical protein